jgi:hypothetical protein
MHQQGKGLLTLKLQDGGVTSSEGNLIIRSIPNSISTTASMPPELSSMCERDTAGWAAEATKGIFLDLKSPSAGAYVAVDLGEVKAPSMLPIHSHLGGAQRHITGCPRFACIGQVALAPVHHSAGSSS